MKTDKLIAELRAERAALDEAIAAVEDLARGQLGAAAQKRRRFSAATRQKAVLAQPKRRTAARGRQIAPSSGRS
jgi:hypothetical protein